MGKSPWSAGTCQFLSRKNVREKHRSPSELLMKVTAFWTWLSTLFSFISCIGRTPMKTAALPADNGYRYTGRSGQKIFNSDTRISFGRQKSSTQLSFVRTVLWLDMYATLKRRECFGIVGPRFVSTFNYPLFSSDNESQRSTNFSQRSRNFHSRARYCISFACESSVSSSRFISHQHESLSS